MNQNSENAGSPLLATGLGCFALLAIPAGLVAIIIYCAQEYWEQTHPADFAIEVGSTGSMDLGPPFPEAENQAIRRHFQALGSTDSAVRMLAWRELHTYHLKNENRLGDMLAQELRRSESPIFISGATWGLCFYYGLQGRVAVVQAALLHKENPTILSGIASGINSLEDPNKKSEMLALVRKALVNAHCPFVNYFE